MRIPEPGEEGGTVPRAVDRRTLGAHDRMMAPRLFHFSEDPSIERFVPGPAVANRTEGREWLNGPLV